MMFLLTFSLALLVVYLSIHVIKLITFNRRAQRYFQTRSPKLPVIPNPSIIAGNTFQTVWNPKNWQLLDTWHKKLGKTFGYYIGNEPWVSTKDIDLIKKIEVDEAFKHLDRVDFRMPLDEFSKSIFQINGSKWRQVRKAVAPILTNHKIRNDEVSSDMMLIIDQFIESVERKLDKAKQATNKRSAIIKVNDHMQRVTLGIIFLTFYKKLNVVDFDADEDYWIGAFDKVVFSILSPFLMLSRGFPLLNPIARRLLRFELVGRVSQRLCDYIEQAVALHQVVKQTPDRMQQKSGPKETPSNGSESDQIGPKRRLIDGFIDALKDGKVSKQNFVSTAHFLLLAGYGTTAGTASCLLWHLADKPDIQTKLRETIINEGIDADYVVWCLLETIRWHPPVPLGVGRVLGDDVIANDGVLIPKGTFVMPTIYTVHHDESIWPDHDKFLPERWRDQSKFHPAAFQGFGLGPRNCVGGKMAMHELKLLFQAILTRYKVERCLETPKQYEWTSPALIFTVPDEPVQIQFTPLSQH